MPSHAEFDLDIPLALRDQLDAKLLELSPDPLHPSYIRALDRRQGVYVLEYQGELVYVGKAKSLPLRLQNHFIKIGGRRKISVADVGFKCLYLSPNWITFSAEDALALMYSQRNLCRWNGAGFGPKDPGKGRDETEFKADHWDNLYPIRQDFPLEKIQPGTYGCLQLLRLMKAQLPFNLRYEKKNPKSIASGHVDYEGVNIDFTTAGMPADELLIKIARSLPNGWQATQFPHQLTIYKKLRDYPSGVIRLFP